jgi:hypothetical protein
MNNIRIDKLTIPDQGLAGFVHVTDFDAFPEVRLTRLRKIRLKSNSKFEVKADGNTTNEGLPVMPDEGAFEIDVNPSNSSFTCSVAAPLGSAAITLWVMQEE